MGDTTSKPGRTARAERTLGLGYARRHSDTTGIETLYVAGAARRCKNQPYGVLRLAMPVDSIEA